VSGVVVGEGVVSVADVGVVCGSGAVAGVISGDAVAAGGAAREGWGSGVELGVIRGDAVASGVAVGAGGGGVLAGWAAGAAGFCSHATTAKLIKAMGTMRYLFMPIKYRRIAAREIQAEMEKD
jgi:hypothetical protein